MVLSRLAEGQSLWALKATCGDGQPPSGTQVPPAPAQALRARSPRGFVTGRAPWSTAPAHGQANAGFDDFRQDEAVAALAGTGDA